MNNKTYILKKWVCLSSEFKTWQSVFPTCQKILVIGIISFYDII